MGYFVVKDREGSLFSAVSGDLKLEQSVNRFSSGPGAPATIGKSGVDAAMTEFTILFHEILSITNLLQSMTSPKLLDHSETNIRHDLTGKSGLVFDQNVKRLLDFVKVRVNPFRKPEVRVPLFNIVSNQKVWAAVEDRLVNALKNGERVYKRIREEVFVHRSQKPTDTIHRRMLPLFTTKSPKEQLQITSKVISAKDVAVAQHNIEIAQLRGMSQEDIYSYDFFNNSPLFDGNITTKPDKSQLVAELEKCLTDDDKVFHPDSQHITHVIIDFMSSTRHNQAYTKFGDMVNAAHLSSTEFKTTMTLIAYDSYVELSLKEGERLRRACEDTIDVIEIKEDTPLPKQMPPFWALSSNKVKLQLLSRKVALRDIPNIVISGMVVDDELLPAQISENGFPPQDLPELSSWIEEADSRIPQLVYWSAQHGCRRILVFSNDTDSVCYALRYFDKFAELGLEEMWIEFGNPRRWIPIHHIHQRIGTSAAKSVIKAHILTGNDHLSKVGTKYAALHFNPAVTLFGFAESHVLAEQDINCAEEYLVKCYNGVRSATHATTFDELRLQCVTSSKVIRLDQHHLS